MCFLPSVQFLPCICQHLGADVGDVPTFLTHQHPPRCAGLCQQCCLVLIPAANTDLRKTVPDFQSPSIKWRATLLSQELTRRKYEMLITHLEGHLQLYTQMLVKSKAERCFPNLPAQWEKSCQVAMSACSQACAEPWSFCLHFLCFVFLIWQYSALAEEF